MTETPGIVVVGGGQAGVAAVSELRERGYDGALTLLGAEPHLPYERPPLSKSVLLGEKEPASTRVHDAAWFTGHDVEVRTSAEVTGIDTDRRTVSTPGGPVAYDQLLLATGSAPRRFGPADDSDARVTYLRTVDEGVALRTALRQRLRVAIVGAGWIGLEVAAAARKLGCDTTVVDPQTQPLLGVMGAQVGAAFANLHSAHDVDLRLGTSVDAVEPGRVQLSDGDVVDADLVVVAIGAAPRTVLAEAAGLKTDDGVLVDARLRTSDPHVFAAGDVARHDHPLIGRRVRVEHWENAVEQGKVAARNLLGDDVPYERLPYFFTDQYDLGMEYVGHVPREHTDSVVVRGDLASLDAVVFWHDDGRVLAAMHVNRWDSTDHLRSLVGRTHDVARLADDGVPLADLAATGG